MDGTCDCLVCPQEKLWLYIEQKNNIPNFPWCLKNIICALLNLTIEDIINNSSEERKEIMIVAKKMRCLLISTEFLSIKGQLEIFSWRFFYLSHSWE